MRNIDIWHSDLIKAGLVKLNADEYIVRNTHDLMDKHGRLFGVSVEQYSPEQLKEIRMSTAEVYGQEDLEDREHKDIRPQLRLLTGGKGPPEPPKEVGDNWLSTLQLRTVFACRQNDKTLDWEMYFLVHKFEEIYLLKWEMPDGKTYDRRVDPRIFSNLYRDYRVIDVVPFPTIEAPQGDDDGNSEQRNQD